MPYKDYEDHLAAQRRWYARNRDGVRASKKLQKARKAGGRERPEICDVCGKTSFRIALGHVKDNPETLRALAAYLETAKRGLS